MDKEMGITVLGDVDDAKDALEDLDKSVEGLEDKIVNINVEVNDEQLRSLEESLSNLSDTLVDVTADTDTTQLEALETTLDELDGSVHTVSVGLDDSASSGIEEIDKESDALDLLAPVIDVSLDTSNFDSALDNLDNVIGNVEDTISIDIEVTGHAIDDSNEIISLLNEIDSYIVQPEVMVDSSGLDDLQSQIDTLNDQSVNVNVDSSGLQNATVDASHLSGGLDTAGVSSDMLGVAIGSIGTIWATMNIEQKVLDFNKYLERTRVLTNATAGEMSALADQARNLFTAKISIAEVAEAQQIFASATGDANDALDAMPGIMDVVKVSGADLNKTTAVGIDLFQKFGGSASETGDLMTYLAAATTQMTMSGDQVTATLDRMGTQLVQMGLSGEDAVNMLWAFDKSGLSAREVTMAMRSGFTQLIQGFVEGSPKLAQIEAGFQKLGIATRDANGNLVPLGPIVLEAADKLAKMENGTNKSQIAMDIFGKQANKTYGILKVSPAEAAEAFGNSADEIVQNVRNVNAEHMTLQDRLGKLYDWLISMIPPWAAKVVAGVSIIVGALALIGTAMSAASEAVASGTGGMVAIMLNNLSGLLGGVTARMAAIVGVIDVAMAKIVIAFQTGGISGAFSQISSLFMGLLNSIRTAMAGAVTSATTGSAGIVAGMRAGQFGATLQAIANTFSGFLNSFRAGMMMYQAEASGIAITNNAIVAAQGGFVSRMGMLLGELVATARTWIVKFIATLAAGEISAAFGMIVSTVTTGLTTIRNAIIAAEASNPVGWILILIGVLASLGLALAAATGQFETLADKQEKAKTAMQELSTAMSDARTSIDEANKEVTYWQEQVDKSTPGTVEYATATKQLQTAKENVAEATANAKKAEEDYMNISTQHQKVINDYNTALNEARHSYVAYQVATGRMTQAEADHTLQITDQIAAIDESDKATVQATNDLREYKRRTDEGRDSASKLPEPLRGIAGSMNEVDYNTTKATSGWDKFMEVLGVISWLSPLKWLLDSFQGIVHLIYGQSPGIIPGLQTIQALLATAWSFVSFEGLRVILDSVLTTLYNVVAYIWNLPGQIGIALQNLYTQFTTWLSQIPNTFITFIADVQKRLGDFVVWLYTIPDQITAWGQGIYQSFWDSLNNTYLTIVNFFTVTIPKAFSDFINYLYSIPGQIVAAGKKMIDDFKNSLVSAWRNVENFFKVTVPNAINSFIEWLKSIPGILYNKGKEMMDNFLKGFGVSDIVDKLRQIYCAIVGCSPGIVPALKEMEGAGNDNFTKLANYAKNTVDEMNRLDLSTFTEQIDTAKFDTSVNLIPKSNTGFTLPTKQIDTMQRTLTPVEPKIELSLDIKVDKIDATTPDQGKQTINEVADKIVEKLKRELPGKGLTPYNFGI